MSTVVAAGNGSLSNGRFKALAPELKLVLVKVGTLSRVHHDDIARGIEWVLINRERFNIRILNISCGGDYQASYLSDVMSRFAEAAVRAGITVVAAVGNSGHRGPGNIMPPASVPAVISGRSKSAQHMVNGVLARRVDADSQTRVFHVAQMILDVAQSVMAAVRPPGPYTQLAER